MIIDKTGKIVFKGHPANRSDLVKDFDDLLADKALEGVAAEDGEGEGESGADEGPGATIDDIKKAMTQMDKFREDGKELQASC